jgi:RNA polymerase sigma factor (sigma-70 family)
MNGVMRHLRRAALPGADGVSDGRLLDDFRARRDEAAFEALLRRHGPMVLGVCRRVLRQQEDAEDAFQATFLVLARKAASIRTQAVGNWLYGVAYRTAMKARAMTAKRRIKERQARQMPRPEPEEDWRELLPVLDRELSRLPDRYRAPVVLCELEGKSRKEAAGQLGLAEGTLSSRLARGRAILARRLGGRTPVAAVGVLDPAREASARVPAGLLGATAAAATGTAPARVAALTTGVLKTMLLNKLRNRAALGLALALLVLGVGTGAYQMSAVGQDVAPPPSTASGRAAPQKQTDEQKERKMLEGTWEMIAVESDGKKQDATQRKTRLTFRDKAFTLEQGEKVTARGTFTIDPSKKPRPLDLTFTEGGMAGKTVPAIYEVKGDELWECFAATGDARPTGFTAEKGSNRLLFIYRRVKSAEVPGEGGREELDLLISTAALKESWAAHGEAVRKELKMLEGTWEMVFVVGDGKQQDFGRPIHITIRGDRFTAERVGTSTGKSLIGKGPLKVDPGKKPKAIDFITTEGPGKGTQALMLYEVLGDELRLCETRADESRKDLPRPTEFSAGPGSGRAISTLRRVKSDG